MRIILSIALVAIACSTRAQRPELAGEQPVQDSVTAAIQRDLANGLWAEPRANGQLAGTAMLEMVIDDKGRCESVRMVQSDLPIVWKNAVKDQWFDRKFEFKLAKYHKQKITIELHFP